VPESRLVDTDILVDQLRGVDAAGHYLDRLEAGAVLTVSSITEMELLIGCRDKRDLRRVDRLVARFRRADLDAEVGSLAADLLRRTGSAMVS